MQHTTRPEYTYHYHWGRIIAAGTLLVALMVAIFWQLSDTAPPSPQISSSKPPQVVEQPTSQSQTAPLKTPLQTTNTSPADIASKTTKTMSQTPDIELKTAEKIDTAKDSIKPKVIVKSELQIQPVTAIKSTTDATDTRTKAKLFTEAIKRAKLTAVVDRREPGETLPINVTLDDSGLSKVYFYTEVIGQAGKTIYHHWYQDGNLKAKVPISIGSDRWRCYSSKYLTDKQTGEWTVKVTDTNGKLLAKSQFNFTNNQ